MKVYTVYYMMTMYDTEKMIVVLARSKEDAYTKAMFEEIPKVEGSTPYHVFVHAVTYQNGKYRVFQNCGIFRK